MPRGIYPPFQATCHCGNTFATRTPKITARACSLRCHLDLGREIKGPDECWPWTLFCDRDGYGEFRFRGKKWRAHRAAYFLDNGTLPPAGLLVLHSCDNRPCCNPAHFFVGTIADNTADMDRKGRRQTARGIEAGNVVLDDSKVRFIRQSKESVPELASRFGVQKQCIYKIRQGVRWRHVAP